MDRTQDTGHTAGINTPLPAPLSRHPNMSNAVPTTILLVTGKNNNKAFRTPLALYQEQLQSATNLDSNANKENVLSPPLIRQDATLSTDLPQKAPMDEKADPRRHDREEAG